MRSVITSETVNPVHYHCILYVVVIVVKHLTFSHVVNAKRSNRLKKMLVVLMSSILRRCLLLILLVDYQKKASSMLTD